MMEVTPDSESDGEETTPLVLRSNPIGSQVVMLKLTFTLLAIVVTITTLRTTQVSNNPKLATCPIHRLSNMGLTATCPFETSTTCRAQESHCTDNAPHTHTVAHISCNTPTTTTGKIPSWIAFHRSSHTSKIPSY